jgi:hypothetical protein
VGRSFAFFFSWAVLAPKFSSQTLLRDGDVPIAREAKYVCAEINKKIGD